MNKKDAIVQITVTQDAKEQLIKEANEKGLSLSSYIRLIINERNK